MTMCCILELQDLCVCVLLHSPAKNLLCNASQSYNTTMDFCQEQQQKLFFCFSFGGENRLCTPRDSDACFKLSAVLEISLQHMPVFTPQRLTQFQCKYLNMGARTNSAMINRVCVANNCNCSLCRLPLCH